MNQPRILTFNFHEPYLCLMAKTGLAMDVGVYERGPLAREWHALFRPLPQNLTLVPEDLWRRQAAEGYYDVIIAHNETNALDVAHAPAGRILVCHNRRTFLNTTIQLERPGANPLETFDRLLDFLGGRFEFVFISESKRADYGRAGRVILPGIDLDEWGGYEGGDAQVFRIGNTMRQRTLMFDFDLQERVCAGLPSRVVGVNADVPGAQPADSFEELQRIYRNGRCLLHVSQEAYEDGYNLTMLEAMATGMPVVALANATSPIVDGVNGFVSPDEAVLHDRLAQLLADASLARQIGAAGRQRVSELFPLKAFVTAWRQSIFDAAERSQRPHWRQASAAERRRNVTAIGPRILMHYVASPLTTGRYLESAARAMCQVTTMGFRIPEEVLTHWGFAQQPPPYPPHDIPTGLKDGFAEILPALGDRAAMDFYLWVDSGPEKVPDDIQRLTIPKVAYLIDTHVTPDLRLAMARHFDVVFLAQLGQLAWFREQGIHNAHWLPLACAPELHALPPCARDLDVAYVGGISPEEGERRRTLLAQVRQAFPNHFIGKAWPAEMAAIYARAKIVVNVSHNRDVNMRVFEAMASGALLITDQADGLAELFTPGEHLIVVEDDSNLVATIAQYLADDETRERIAAAGQAKVLAKHSYEQRFRALLAIAGEICGPFPEAAPPRPKQRAYYECPRREVIPHVPLHTRRLLDVGCGAGVLASTLKRERGLDEVVGVEIIEAAWEEARRVLDCALFGSVESMELPYPDEYFDCIICADVLEHLVEPAMALRKLGRVLARDGRIVVSIPNIRYHEVVGMLASGAWTYMDAGIMDATHLRFFCEEDLRDLARNAGLEVLKLEPLNIRYPELFPRNTDGTLDEGLVKYLDPSEKDYEALRVYQYAVVIGKPGVDRLERARALLEVGQLAAAEALALDACGVDERARQTILAKVWSKSGRLAEADKALCALRETEEDYELAGEHGILLVAMGRAEEAITPLRKAIAALPDFDRAEAALGLALMLNSEEDAALTHLLRALSANRAHLVLWQHVLPLARSLGKLSHTLPILGEHIDHYSGNLELRADYAEVLAEAGHVEEAMEQLNMLLLFAPDHVRGNALLQQLREDAGT